jgi:hypothetical protein
MDDKASNIYNYCVSGHFPLSSSYLKQNVSETDARLQIEPTQFDTIDGASSYLPVSEKLFSNEE